MSSTHEKKGVWFGGTIPSTMILWSLFLCFLVSVTTAATATRDLRCLVYYTKSHQDTPPVDELQRVTHVAIAFLSPEFFNEPKSGLEPLFTTVDDVRAKFAPDTKVLISLGGWGEMAGFETAAWNDFTRSRFAKNLADAIKKTGADGVDFYWQYPGGNGEDYKLIPNEERVWEIDAYPLLLEEVRKHLEEGKIISVTVPGLKRDMIAYTSKTVPKIAQHADFLNVMTYDLMNRRDPFTKHHSGLNQSLEAIDTYLSLGAGPEKLNLGLAFYARWFKTDHDNCMWDHIGCPTIGLEDPETGADLNNSGVVYWSDPAPANVNGAKVAESLQRALKYGKYEYKGGGYYYWDGSDDLQNIWWTFDTPDAIKRKFPLVVEERGLGGVFAMGIGEDAPKYDHFNAFIRGVEDYVQGGEETSYGREGKKGGRF